MGHNAKMRRRFPVRDRNPVIHTTAGLKHGKGYGKFSCVAHPTAKIRLCDWCRQPWCVKCVPGKCPHCQRSIS
jgi:hypothetical protein